MTAYKATKNIKGRTISTTRDKNFSKTRDGALQISGADIAFKLDGNKLSNRYKVMPYDDTYDQSDKEYNPNDVKSFGDEQEEVWYGDTLDSYRGFKNLKNYVIEIILTKRFLKLLVKSSKFIAAFVKDEAILHDYINDYNNSPSEKLNVIKKWYENHGYKVEIEK